MQKERFNLETERFVLGTERWTVWTEWSDVGTVLIKKRAVTQRFMWCSSKLRGLYMLYVWYFIQIYIYMFIRLEVHVVEKIWQLHTCIILVFDHCLNYIISVIHTSLYVTTRPLSNILVSKLKKNPDTVLQ